MDNNTQILIKKLKDLSLVRECALNYDHVPNKDQADNICENILYETPKEIIEPLLEIYEGYSVSNVTDVIMSTIDEL